MGTINKLTKLVLSFLLVITCINFSIVQAEDGSDENYSEPTAVETISEEPASEPEQEVIPEEPVAEEPVVEEAAPVEEEKQEEVTPEVTEEAKVEEENNIPVIEAEPATQEETVEPEVQQEAPVEPEVQKVETVEEVKVTVVVSYVDESDHPLTDPITGSYPTEYRLDENVDAFKSFDGYDFEKVIVNDDAKNTISKDDVQKNGFKITKDMTSLKLVYQKMNLESNENKEVIPEATEEAVEEAEPESNTNETELSAFDQTAFAGKVGVHASAAEGVLPKGARLIVEQVNRKAILNAVENTVSDNNKEMDSAVALDISIVDKDGNKIQPNGIVNITFVNTGVSGDEVKIYHVEDDASAVTEIANNTDSFDASHFSIYVITGENQPPLTTFNFVVNDTVNDTINTISTQIVKSGDTLIAPTAPDMIGQAFVGWVDEAGNPFTGFGKQSEITETTTRTITARYEAALYVYFLNPDGSQIMRTEKVGDHEKHDFTTVSYEVDSTHKLVGWAYKASGTTNIADKISVPANQTSVNVYAIIKEGYWISFDSDGGSIVDSQFVLNGDKLTINESTTPTKPGYTFDDWYDGSSKVENGATVTNPMTLKAHWEAAQVNYTINYWQQKVTDDKNATDAQKAYEYVEAETKKATTGTRISATNLKTYKGFKYNENNSSKDVEISGDGTTIINVYYDRELCTVNFYTYKRSGWSWDWEITKTVTGLYGANLPEGAWDTSNNLWFTSYYGGEASGSNAVLLTSFDFETAGYAKNAGNPKPSNGVVTTCNFYAGSGLNGTIKYYNEQADGTFKLVQTVRTNGNSLTVHEKYEGYELYKYSTGSKAQETAQYWKDRSSVKDSDEIYGDIINIASKLKTYSLSYYNYNSVTKTEKNIKYTAPLKSYANYTPARPSGLPEYYVFGGWYKDKACTTEFDFNTEKMPNANVQIYAKWTAKKISLTYNLNNPEGTVDKGTTKVAAGTIASTVLPSASAIEGYTFAGWYVADENGHLTTVPFNANDAILRDTNVIGKWLYNGKLTVKYVADGVEAPKDNNVYAGGAKATVANGVTKDGKKFLGWQLDGKVYQPCQNFEVNKNLADDKNVITLTAVFGDSETSAILTYHCGNGNGEDQSVAILNNVEVTLESTSNLHYSAPGKDYYFAGWATSMGDARKGNAKYAVGDKVRVNADSSNDLYATWVKKTVIEVTANSKTPQYNGEVQKVEGFKVVTAGYEVTGLTAVATGKDAGTYENKITGKATVTKGGVDVTNKVIVNKINGTLTISKREVTLTSQTDSKPYDGTALTRPYVTITGGFVKDEVKEVKATGSVTNVSEGGVTNTITYKTSDKFNPDNYKITKDEGKLSITPVTDEVTVTIKGNSKTTPYNGEEQSVSGYTVESISNTLYSSTDFTLNGQATATGKDANTYPMNLDATQFVNNNTNFSNVKFEIAEDGQLVITPVTDKVTVTIKGHEDTATYDGNPHSVEGYEVTNISNKLYKENDIGFTGEAKAEGIEAATYQMNLTAQQFSNISQNFTNVEFVVEDGSLTINPKSITPDGPNTPEEKKTGITVTAPEGSKYDGEEHKNKPTVTDTKTDKVLVEGTDYELSYSKDVINAGKVTVTVTGIGNYTGEFDVTYEITKRDVVLTSATDSKPYDGTALRNENVEVTGDGFAVGEGATFAVTGTITNVGTKANTFGYALNKNTLASNYNISTELGTLTITPKSIIPDGPETPDDEKTGITVENPGDVKYDGKDHAEKPVVKDEKTGVTLEEGKDYEIVYPDDIKNAGEITATVVGKGDYEGSFEIKYNITKRDVTFTSATDSKQYDGNALTNGNVEITGDGFIEGEGAEYKVTGTQTQVGNSANEFEYTLNENTLASNYDITKVVGTLTVTAAPAPETPEKPKPEVKKSVDTSDDNNIVFYGNAFFMAMITLAGIIVLRKKSS